MAPALTAPELQRTLTQVEPAALRSLLRRELASAGLSLDELTFPLIVNLGEAYRPTLAVPFAELALELPHLLAPTLEKVLGFVGPGEARAEVVRLIGPQLLEAARRANDQCPHELWAIAGAHPSATLAFLRATHPTGVRSIEEETRAERLGAAAEALLALKRPRQAERLFKKLVAGSSPPHLAALARGRLADLS